MEDGRVLAQGGQARIELRAVGQGLGVERVALDRDAPVETVPVGWDHPHLVRVLRPAERGRTELLEYAPGGSLTGLLAARGPLPLGEAVTLMVPLAAALAHLHAAGVVHGDVAPDNVLFRADGAPLLADPGLATALGEARGTGGTDGFAAPEHRHGPPADVYGWGAVAWFALSGRAPGERDARVPMPLLRQDVPAGVACLIEDCLDPDPSMRPPAGELGPELLALHPAAALDATPAAGEQGAPLLLTRVPGPGKPSRRGVLKRGRDAGTWGWSPSTTGTGPSAVARQTAHDRRRSGSRRPLLAGAAAAAGLSLVVAAVVVGAADPEAGTRRHDGGAGASAPAEGPRDAEGARGTAKATAVSTAAADRTQAAEATAALMALDQERAAAFASGEEDRLASVYTDGEARRADRDLLARWEAQDAPRTLSSHLEGVRVLEGASRERVRLAASTVTEVDGGAAVRHRRIFTLLRTPEGWRVERVEDATG